MCLKWKRESVQAVDTNPQSAFTPTETHHGYDSTSSDEEYSYGIEERNPDFVGNLGKKCPTVNLKINDISCQLIIDTGSTVNLLDEETYKKVGKPRLSKHGVRRLQPYGGGPPLQVLGQCELTVETSKQIQYHKFYVVSGNHGALLSYSTAKNLDLIHIVNAIASLTSAHPKLFNGIGKLNDRTVKIHIDKTVKPVAQ